MNLVLQLRKPYLKMWCTWFQITFHSSVPLCLHWSGNTRGFIKDGSFKYSCFPSCSGPYCPLSCSVPCYYVILSSPVLITSWRTGPLMLISRSPLPVSALQTSHREVLWAAAMRDCDVSQPVYTMTVLTPSSSSFCQGALTRSSLSLRQRSP